MNYDIDTNRYHKLQKFKNSLAESVEFRDLEKAINKMIFMGEDHKSNQNYGEINTRIDILGKKPSNNLISKWLKPKGLNKNLEEMSDVEFKRILKKQEILVKKKLVDLKNHFKPFELTKPGIMRNIENEIHKELFETDLHRSSTYLELIEELEGDTSRINSSMNKSGYSISETTPTGIKHTEVTLPRGSNYRFSPQNSVMSTSYRIKTDRPASTTDLKEVGNIVQRKITEIEGLIINANMNLEARSGILNTINTLKKQINTEIYAKKSKSRTPEKYLESSPSHHYTSVGLQCSGVEVETGRRKPLLKLTQNHQSGSIQYLQGSAVKRTVNYKSVLGSGKKKEVKEFDLRFLVNHNFSTDMISAFQ